MTGPPLRSGGEDITWPDQVAPQGRKVSSTRKLKPQTSNLDPRRVQALHGGAGAGAEVAELPPWCSFCRAYTASTLRR